MSATAPTVVLCPRDGTQLVEVERGGVSIDACPTCRGIWLDRGELEKLIAHERAGATDDDFLHEVSGQRNTSDRPADEDKPNLSGGKRKRGSFLENFLDFGGD